MTDGVDRMRERFLVFGAPLIGEAEIDEVVDSLRSGWLGTGPKVARFERAFAAYKVAEQAVAGNSCTAALHLSLLAADLGPGDEVSNYSLEIRSIALITFSRLLNALILI